MKRIFFFIVGLIGMIFRYIYIIISEILLILWDILNFIIILVISSFWALVKFGRRILGMPYNPNKVKNKKNRRK